MKFAATEAGRPVSKAVLTRFTWERALRSDTETAPTTKLVLLTLATHANRQLQAWSSIATQAAETGLSERAIGLHLDRAEQRGWIVRELRGSGKAWRSYRYTLRFAPERPSAPMPSDAPESRSAASTPEPFLVPRGEPRAHGPESGALGPEQDDKMVPNYVRPNIEVIIPENKAKNTSELRPAFKKSTTEQVNGNTPSGPLSDEDWDILLAVKHKPGDHPNDRARRTAHAKHAYRRKQTPEGR